MNRALAIVVVMYAMTYLASGLYTGDFIPLGKPCNPADSDLRPNSQENSGKVCTHGAKCNPEIKICDCSDSDDGRWKRTFENGECRLLPGSVCIPNVDQDFYRCVQNSKCTVTRKGQDPSKCPADAPCDTGDAECICESGKSCLTKVVPATAS